MGQGCEPSSCIDARRTPASSDTSRATASSTDSPCVHIARWKLGWGREQQTLSEAYLLDEARQAGQNARPQLLGPAQQGFAAVRALHQHDGLHQRHSVRETARSAF